jgi:hypothetical protein
MKKENTSTKTHRLGNIAELSINDKFRLIGTGEIGIVKGNNKEGVTYRLESKEDLQKISKSGVMWVIFE